MGATEQLTRPAAPSQRDLEKADPLVTVVIIFLDAQRFLREAIESVFTQSYDAWELLLVDDGSSDESGDIAKSFAAEHPERVRYLEHAGHVNCGMSASRNLGIRHAAGEYVAFLDADDVWLPDKLGEQVRILEREPAAAMVFGPATYWYGWTNAAADADRDFVQCVGPFRNEVVPGPKLLSQFVEREGTTPSPSGVLVRRRALDSIGGFEASFTGLFEDQAFYAKACLSHDAYVADRVWYRYRQHENGACAVAERTDRIRQARAAYLRWLEKRLEAAGDAHRATLATVRDTIRRRPLGQARPSNWISKLRATLRRIASRRGGRRRVRWGSLRRVEPVSRQFGADRGKCVDRWYIERFLREHAADIHGRVLEIGADTYTRRFGANRVTRADVLHAEPGSARATFVGDLADGANLPSDRIDCVILTQTLHLIDDVRAAVATVHRILRPGGVVLATLPGISQISRYDMDRWGDRWRFTTLSAEELFERIFHDGKINVRAHGNVLTATAFLQGISAEELTRDELTHHDADYPLVITVRAEKHS